MPTREDVKQWMLEQQLGRRNLSEAERYEIVQKFKNVIKQKAKENQSSGGKGLSNLSKVNTRKEMAKVVGVSEGTYQKMERNREWETFEKEYKKSMEIDLKTSKDFYKQCYRVLAKSIHPDTGGDLEAMQYLNQLKSIWGV